MNNNIDHNIWDVFNALVRMPLASEKHNLMSAIMLMIFLDFLRFYQVAYSPQGKRSVIFNTKHDMYQSPHEFLNNLRLRILGSSELPSLSPKIKLLSL